MFAIECNITKQQQKQPGPSAQLEEGRYPQTMACLYQMHTESYVIDKLGRAQPPLGCVDLGLLHWMAGLETHPTLFCDQRDGRQVVTLDTQLKGFHICSAKLSSSWTGIKVLWGEIKDVSYDSFWTRTGWTTLSNKVCQTLCIWELLGPAPACDAGMLASILSLSESQTGYPSFQQGYREHCPFPKPVMKLSFLTQIFGAGVCCFPSLLPNTFLKLLLCMYCLQGKIRFLHLLRN